MQEADWEKFFAKRMPESDEVERQRIRQYFTDRGVDVSLGMCGVIYRTEASTRTAMPWVTIEQARLLACKNPKYGGRTKPQYLYKTWTEEVGGTRPLACRVEVRVDGGFYVCGQCVFAECATDDSWWHVAPFEMSARIAEIEALRAAFPAQLMDVKLRVEYVRPNNVTPKAKAAAAEGPKAAQTSHTPTPAAASSEPIPHARIDKFLNTVRQGWKAHSEQNKMQK